MEIDEIIIEEDVDVFGKEDMRLFNIGIKPDLANDWKEANDKKSVFHSDKLLLNPFFNYYISQCTEEEVIAWREYKGRGLRDKQYGTLLTYKNTKVLELTKEVKVHTVENYEELNESLIAENKILKEKMAELVKKANKLLHSVDVVEANALDYEILLKLLIIFRKDRIEVDLELLEIDRVNELLQLIDGVNKVNGGKK